MSAKTHYFRIGLFVLTGAALLVGGLFAIGLRANLGKRDVFETAVAGKVENLSVGALVMLRGVTIGKVSSIDFVGKEYPEYRQQYVLIHFEVPRGDIWSWETGDVQQLLDTEAARGLRARVQGQGFLGASILALEYVDPRSYPVEPIPWHPKHYYIPSAPGQLTRVMASLERSLGNVQDLDLSGLLDRAKGLLDDARHVADNVDQVNFGQLGTNAESLLVEIRETVRGLQRTISDVQNAVNGADLPAISRDASALVAKLSNATRELHRLLASVDTGELNSSLANVRAATDDLVILIHELEQRPSSVIFSKPPNPLSQMDKPPRK